MADWVLVTNACTTPLKRVEWTRAVTMVVTGLADIVSADETRQVRSAYMSIPWPLVVQLRKYVFVPYVGHGGDPVDRATRSAILSRDALTCGYCGKRGDTIDHIFPRSRGGDDSWSNLITACFECNQKKADRLPEEAGMKVLWPPRYVDLRTAMPRRHAVHGR